MASPKGLTSREAMIFYLHSMAHVEANAINLCWDTLVRFRHRFEMPEGYYEDVLSVADDESRHCVALSTRLRELGSGYGALPSHDMIWLAAQSTESDLTERLAIGQLVQEARGLDAAPRIAQRFNSWNDHKSAKLVQKIGDEEVRHVHVGVKWYLHICEEQGVQNPIARYHDIALKQGNYGAFHPPFNEQRRSEAGLYPEWYMPVSEPMTSSLKARKIERRRLEQRTDATASRKHVVEDTAEEQ